MEGVQRQMTLDPLLTAEQVAALTSRTVRAIRQATWRGDVPGVVKLGRLVRYRESAIRAWINPRGSLPGGKGRDSASESKE